MSGDGYTLYDGFWSGIISMVEDFYCVFLPLIFKNYGP